MAEDAWTDDFLGSMRQETDPTADEVVRRLFDEQGLAAVSSLHGQILRNDGLPIDDLPSYFADYLRATADPPAWIDRSATARAAAVLSSNGLIAFSILGCASLPECYVDRPGVPVLWLTQQMNAHVYRRTIETSQFVIGVMSPNGLERGGGGRSAAQKVRLMHAAIRHLILAEPDDKLALGLTKDIVGVFLQHQWQHELGLPINQEDMAYTLQTFAWVTVRGMRDLGCDLNAEDEAAIIHVWNVAGDAMGIRRDLMPGSVAEAETLFTRIKNRVAASCEGSVSMEAALLSLMEEMTPPAMLAFRHLPRMLTRHLIGDTSADLLGIPRLTAIEQGEAQLLLDGMRLTDALQSGIDQISPFRKAAELVFKAMSGQFTQMPRQWQRSLFQIPDSLATSWKLKQLS